MMYEITEVDGSNITGVMCLGPMDGYEPSGELDISKVNYWRLYVTSVAEGAFAGCDITSVTMSDVVSIGADAFSGCDLLESVTILSDTPPTVGGGAFDTGTTISVTTGGWNPVSVMSTAHGSDTIIVWANGPEFPDLVFASDPSDGVVAYSKP